MISPARRYHALSSYDIDRHWTETLSDPLVRQDFLPMRPEVRPWEFKRYDAKHRVHALPRDTPDPGVSAASVLCGELPSRVAGPLSLNEVAAILFETAGVVRRRGETLFRAASSAGNRHPVETYLCAKGIQGLSDGVWHYDPLRHALTLIGPAPAGDESALVVTGVPWRTCWRYAERGYRHVWWDCGTMLSQALMACRSRGIDACLHTGFDDGRVSELLGLSRHEFPLVVLALGSGRPAIVQTGPAVAGDLGPGYETFPLVDAVHHAGDLAGEAATRPVSGGWPVMPVPQGVGRRSCAELVRTRGSARRFDQALSVPGKWLMDLIKDEPRVRLLVHAVQDMRPGVYHLDAKGHFRIGSIEREVSQTLCLGQELGRDAAMLVLFGAAGGWEDDARAYRTALLGAGLAMGKLYLAAGALGIGCTGLTMVDSLLPMVFGEEIDGLAICALGIRRKR